MNGYLPQTGCTPEQYHCNYGQIDHHTTRLLNSDEAKKITGQMHGIYTMLKIAPWDYWEGPNRLRVIGDATRTAWQILCELANTSSATLRKAIKWMAEKGVIKYWSWKNGIGLRIYFNLAINSVRQREPQKNLRLVPASTQHAPASESEVALYESEAFRDIQDSDLDASRVAPATPTAEPASNVVAVSAAAVELPAPVAEVAASVAPTKPTLQLVPPPRPQLSTELQLAFVEALSRKVGELEQAVKDVAKAIPNKDFLLNQLAGKVGRVAAETLLRMEGRGKSNNAYVGAAPPTVPESALAPRPPIIHTEFWQGVLARVKAQARVSAENFETWFAPLNAQRCNNVVVITAPDDVFRDWVENNYADVLDDVGLEQREWEVCCETA